MTPLDYGILLLATMLAGATVGTLIGLAVCRVMDALTADEE